MDRFAPFKVFLQARKDYVSVMRISFKKISWKVSEEKFNP